MSRAQSVRLLFELGGLALGVLLFLFLLSRLGLIPAFLVAAAVWLVLGSLNERRFRRHASPEEIRADLDDRKNAL